MAQPATPRRSRRRRYLAVVAAAVFVLLVAGAGFGLWYVLVGPPSPQTVTAGPPGVPAGASVPPPASLDGQWQVNTSLGMFGDFSSSWAGYRVKEQLVGLGGHTAVGRTPRVSGSMTLSGSTVTDVSITTDLTALASDDPARDEQLRRQGLATDTFPTAAFSLTGPLELGALPADGQTVAVTASGKLTLHGVTRPVQIAIQALRKGGIIAVAGSMQVVFADYGFEGPRSFSVLSVEDHGTMELHLLFVHI